MNRASAVTLTIFFLGVWLLASRGYAADLTWKFSDSEDALCNDFTRAGFFHRNPDKEPKWVIFLESGSLCYSNETCNRRYFQSNIRERYSTDLRGRNIFGNFDTALAWKNTGAAGQPLTEVVNPLMTSLYCFENETQYFTKEDGKIAVEGTDVLSKDCAENPTFCKHGHVLVPYCSSDVWLGSESASNGQNTTQFIQEPCDCWDQNCFKYNPTSGNLQFTFRGQTIFRSVMQTLDRMYNLQEASEIVLMGSSAGGVGVLNSAKWVREEYQNVTIKVVADSSWFINFRDSINQEFGAITQNNEVLHNESSTHVLLGLLESNEACNDTRLGYPCCLSAQCILLEKSRATGEPYYPRDVPLFALTSLYDVFLLANSLAGLVPLQTSEYSTAGLALQFLTTIGEYGGAMNASVIDTAIAASRSSIKFSYYAAQCFQHTYFTTSSLRGEGRLLGSEAITISAHITTIR